MGNLPLDLAVKSVYLQRYVSFFMYDFFFLYARYVPFELQVTVDRLQDAIDACC